MATFSVCWFGSALVLFLAIKLTTTTTLSLGASVPFERALVISFQIKAPVSPPTLGAGIAFTKPKNSVL
jgi:hypothetical protein